MERYHQTFPQFFCFFRVLAAHCFGFQGTTLLCYYGSHLPYSTCVGFIGCILSAWLKLLTHTGAVVVGFFSHSSYIVVYSQVLGGTQRCVDTRGQPEQVLGCGHGPSQKMVGNHSCSVSWCRVCTDTGPVRCCSFLEGRVCNLSSRSVWSAGFENTKHFNEIKTFFFMENYCKQRYPPLAELLLLLLPSPLRPS